MKKKWMWLYLVLAAAVIVGALFALGLLEFSEANQEEQTTPTTTTPTTTTTTTAPVEDVVISDHLSFTGKVLELDGDSVLMECYDKDKFDTVWVNISQTGVAPKEGEEYTVIYEDMVMPSLPPRITAVRMVTKPAQPPISEKTSQKETTFSESWESRYPSYKRIPKPNGKIVYLGKELPEGKWMIYCDNTVEENSGAMLLPVPALLRAAGAKVLWKSDTIAEVTYKEKKAILDTQQGRMYNIENDHEEYLIPPPGGFVIYYGTGEQFVVNMPAIDGIFITFGIPRFCLGAESDYEKGVFILETLN